MNQTAFTVIVFALVYAWLIVSRRHRAKAIWVGIAALFVLPLLAGARPVMVPWDIFAREGEAGRRSTGT